MKDLAIAFGRTLDRMYLRCRQMFCFHQYHWVFENRHTFLRCTKCLQETIGWDIRDIKPPTMRYLGDPERFRIK